MLVSTVQKSESATSIHTSPLFCISFQFWSPQNCGHHRTVTKNCVWSQHRALSSLCHRFSSVISFVYSSVYKSVPISQPISLPFPLGIQTFVLTIQYYLAIKRNKIGSFVQMWMDLEAVIQSEVSQKEKNKHHILTHIWGIWKNTGIDNVIYKT